MCRLLEKALTLAFPPTCRGLRHSCWSVMVVTAAHDAHSLGCYMMSPRWQTLTKRPDDTQLLHFVVRPNVHRPNILPFGHFESQLAQDVHCTCSLLLWCLKWHIIATYWPGLCERFKWFLERYSKTLLVWTGFFVNGGGIFCVCVDKSSVVFVICNLCSLTLTNL